MGTVVDQTILRESEQPREPKPGMVLPRRTDGISQPTPFTQFRPENIAQLVCGRRRGRDFGIVPRLQEPPDTPRCDSTLPNPVTTADADFGTRGRERRENGGLLGSRHHRKTLGDIELGMLPPQGPQFEVGLKRGDRGRKSWHSRYSSFDGNNGRTGGTSTACPFVALAMCRATSSSAANPLVGSQSGAPSSPVTSCRST